MALGYMHAITEASSLHSWDPLLLSIMGVIATFQIVLPKNLILSLHKGLHHCSSPMDLLWFCALYNEDPTMKYWCNLQVMVCHIFLLHKNNIGTNAYETPILRTLKHCIYKSFTT
jgi:hypothetical protein